MYGSVTTYPSGHDAHNGGPRINCYFKTEIWKIVAMRLKIALLYPPLLPTLYNDELSSLEIAVTCVQHCRWSGGKEGRYSLDHSGLPPKLQIHPETSVHHC